MASMKYLMRAGWALAAILLLVQHQNTIEGGKYLLKNLWALSSGDKCIVVSNDIVYEGDFESESTPRREIRRLVFKPPEGKIMTASAGQGQSVMVWGPGGRCRFYSPTFPTTKAGSVPPADSTKPVELVQRDDHTFDFTIKVYRPEDGIGSRYLAALQPGDVVTMVYPAPPYIFKRNGGKKIGLVALGMGITDGYQAAIRELCEPEVTQVTLLWATRYVNEQNVVLREELDKLEKENQERLKIVRVVTRGNETQSPGVTLAYQGRRVDESLLSEVFPWTAEMEDVRFHVIGTETMMEETERRFDKLGYDTKKANRLLET